jgi:hypothetical protein
MTALGSEEEFEGEEFEAEECEVCQGPATRMCENCYAFLCNECLCPACDEDEEGECERCGNMDANTYDCKNCWRTVCYDCFSFEKNLCVDCASEVRR